MSGTLTSLGNYSKTTFLAEEPRKISLEFTCAADVKKGQPVKLTATGQVTPWAIADLQHLCIGVCLSSQLSGELVTVITRGYVVIFALANAASQVAGISTYKGYDTTHNTSNNTDMPNPTFGYSLWGAPTDVTDMIGWALDAGTAQYDMIRVLIKD